MYSALNPFELGGFVSLSFSLYAHLATPPPPPVRHPTRSSQCSPRTSTFRTIGPPSDGCIIAIVSAEFFRTRWVMVVPSSNQYAPAGLQSSINGWHGGRNGKDVCRRRSSVGNERCCACRMQGGRMHVRPIQTPTSSAACLATSHRPFRK